MNRQQLEDFYYIDLKQNGLFSLRFNKLDPVLKNYLVSRVMDNIYSDSGRGSDQTTNIYLRQYHPTLINFFYKYYGPPRSIEMMRSIEGPEIGSVRTPKGWSNYLKKTSKGRSRLFSSTKKKGD